MSTVKISDLYPSILNEEYCSQLAENLEEIIELPDAQMKSIAGGFWICRFIPRLSVYPSLKSKGDLVA
jgi:hypothetical protein